LYSEGLEVVDGVVCSVVVDVDFVVVVVIIVVLVVFVVVVVVVVLVGVGPGVVVVSSGGTVVSLEKHENICCIETEIRDWLKRRGGGPIVAGR
jgi:hypothetical protein